MVLLLGLQGYDTSTELNVRIAHLEAENSWYSCDVFRRSLRAAGRGAKIA
jgi:hypothetical protein